MPTYEFLCGKCNKTYSSLESFDPTGKYKDVRCTHCDSKKKKMKPTAANIKFGNPKDTSKFDNFSYRAGYNLEMAQNERRAAEDQSHMGSAPYNSIDDVSGGDFFGEVE